MNLIESLKKNKRIWLIILFATVGIMLLLAGGENTGKTEEVSGEQMLLEYSKEVEDKIKELCSKVKGVSDVSVAVSFESGFEYVYARDDDGDIAMAGSGSSKSAIRIKEKMPVISGIGVVCKGGGDPAVQKKLLDLLSAAFGISSNKIFIAEAKK